MELDQRCGCGKAFSECPFWSTVVAALGSRTPDLDAPGVGRRLRQRLRALRLPLMVFRRATGRAAVPSHPDDQRIAGLYRAIAEQSQGAVVVDSSKLPPYGLLLERLPGVELTVLHVVRDPRATAFSWLRHKENDGRLMQRQEVWKSSSLWLMWNLVAAWAWRASAPRVIRLRYEDFVQDPRAAMERVVSVLGLDPDDLPFVDDNAVSLGPTHSVAGNPNRHQIGTVRLAADNEWESSMAASQRALVSLITGPGLVRFGYPVRPAGRALTTRGSSRSA